MKILLIAPNSNVSGGIASWTKQLLNLKENDLNFIIVDNTPIGKRKNLPTQKKNVILECVRLIKILLLLIRNLIRADCVHITTSCTPLSVLRDYICIKLSMRKPIILHCHCNIDDQIGTNKFILNIFQHNIKKAYKVLVLNSQSKKFIDELGEGKSIILPNFISEENVEEKEVNKVVKELIYVGFVTKEKGIDELINFAKYNRNLDITCVGSVDFPYKKINEKNIHFIGSKNKKEVNNLLKNADIFIHLSHSEGFSMALLEAMAKGLPCIVSDVGANRDMIENKGGCVLENLDASTINQALKKLNDYETRKKMSRWNNKKVSSSYLDVIVLSKLKKIYLDSTCRNAL